MVTGGSKLVKIVTVLFCNGLNYVLRLGDELLKHMTEGNTLPN